MKKFHSKIKIKYIVIPIAILVIIIIGYKIYNYERVKNAVVDVKLNKDLTVDVFDKRKLSSFISSINGTLIKDNYIDTTTIGTKKIKFNYINDDNIEVSFSFKLNIVDTISPLILTSNKVNIPLGSDFNIFNDIFCGDNYDDKPEIEVIGTYNLEVEGEYPITYVATDKSGNISERNITLNVYKKNTSSNKNTVVDTSSGTSFSDVVSYYKTDKNKIGIDISKWQGEVNFKKLKESGVEFIFIRVGGTRGVDGEYFKDEYFDRNIAEALKYNIPVGVYFYSYSSSIKKAEKDAKWVLKQIKKYKNITLPVVYDFEDWNNFNSYNVSFYKLTTIAETFMDTVKEAGYDSMLYSSKHYLENIWMDTDYPIWLAHYTKETNYEGSYKYWQLCDDGKIDGIDGFVDIDIMY